MNGSGAKKKVDYDLIEPGWRAGIKSPAQLAAEYTEATGQPVSRVAIIKHFEKRNVPRDLGAKIQAKAESLVAAAAVTGQVTAETRATETAIVEKNGRDVALVALGHRRDIKRGRELVISMLDELESQSSAETREAFRRLGEIMAAPDEYGRDKLNDAYMAAVSLPERIKGVKALTEALKNVVALEREAWGLNANVKPSDAANPVAAFLAGLTGAGACRLPFADGATRTAAE